MSSFNYAKWDNIELSDDESDLHPNIDKESWFRMKHRSRLEREEREDKEMLLFDKANKDDELRVKHLNVRINAIKNGTAGEEAELDDVEGLEAEREELSGKIAGRKAKAAEYLERRKWNIDNICKTKDERTIVSTSAVSSSLKADDFAPTGLTEKTFKERQEAEAGAGADGDAASASSLPPAASEVAKAAAPAPPAAIPTPIPVSLPTPPAAPAPAPAVVSSVGPANPNTAAISYNDYVLAHEELLEQYSEIRNLDDTKDYLFRHCDVLMHEHSQSYMLLSSLEDEMNGKKERMKLVCRQSQILSHIQELGVSMHRDPRDVILPFFHRIAEPAYLKNFLGAVEEFAQRIRERAKVKRREMDLQEAPVGPGGLDPSEVFESLPIEIQEAFESQSVQRLKDVLAAMEPAVAKAHLKRCIDSGLWVPAQGDSLDDDEEGEEEEDGEGK